MVAATQLPEILLEINQTLMRTVRKFLSNHRKHLLCSRRESILVVKVQEEKET